MTYLLPALGALLVGVAGLAVSRRRRSRRRRAGATTQGDIRRWIAAAIVVAIACWSAPLIDVATGDPGNLEVLWDAAMADEPTLGLDVGLRALVFAVGVVPWWLRDPRVGIERVAELGDPPGTSVLVTALLVLGALAVVTLVGQRRRRTDVFAAGVVAIVLCVALVQFTSSVPKESFVSVGYGLWWASPVGMFVWLVVGWSLLTLLAPARRSRRVARRLRLWMRPELAAPAAFAAVLATGLGVALDAEWRKEPFDTMSVIGERLCRAAPEADARRGRGEEGLRLPGAGTPDGRRQLAATGRARRRYGAQSRVLARAGVRRRGPCRSRRSASTWTPPPPGSRVLSATRSSSSPTRTIPFGAKVAPRRVVTVSLLPLRADR